MLFFHCFVIKKGLKKEKDEPELHKLLISGAVERKIRKEDHEKILKYLIQTFLR